MTPTPTPAELDALAQAVCAHDRAALARAITLVESTREADRVAAAALLSQLRDATPTASHRIGISGAPGAGKSSFIDAFGMGLVAAGHRVAVLAVDPSSVRSGGSILGDKTRMAQLARHADAFIRPSPAQGLLGGVARRTREVIAVCEAAGFDRIVVETVGVGQSEVEVAELVDTVVVLLLAGGGDELQGIKRGLLECADVIVVPKADGDNVTAARQAAAVFQHAIAFVPPRHADWTVPVLTCSAHAGDGMAQVASAIAAHRDHLVAAGGFATQRGQQRVRWAQRVARELLVRAFDEDPAVAEELRHLTPAITDGAVAVDDAAARLLARFRRGDAETVGGS
ncbi:MAG: methylmalonyl Co-A mutase-associated GTPase MeaB [Nannocystaceae bacterium]|nr:methylmalonyl Co-A mutase-associated GTPase MeaB [Nannocystaceae bacterium]